MKNLNIDIDALEKSPLYSEELGIKLFKNTDEELFKWFLASILFGACISETIAKHTYKSFEEYKLLTPEKILAAGWDFLVNPVMREGGYVRYDESTSRELLRTCEKLIHEYNGSLKMLHHIAKDSDDLERRLMEFYGVGPVTSNIFLRELRSFWSKSNPKPLQVVNKLADSMGIDLSKYNRKTLTFIRLEAGLIRLRKTISANKTEYTKSIKTQSICSTTGKMQQRNLV